MRMIDAAALLAHPGLEVDYRYDQRKVMLYALATALPTDPMDTDQLPFAYEDLPNQPLLALPTLPIILGWVDLVRDPRTRDPMLGIDGDKVVVGQASLVLHRAIATEGSGRARTFYAKVVDKGAGRGALVCVRREVYDVTQGLLATIDTWLFVRGAGGFGGPQEGGPPRTPVPARAPDGFIENGTSAQQALLYRLVLGDHNAVHADPVHAVATGFPQPILHGLASLSMGIHAALRGATGSLKTHTGRLRSAYATLASPVYPGDHLRTEAWVQGTDIRFRTSVPARALVAVEAGSITLDPL
jgi:acyl dehydratase